MSDVADVNAAHQNYRCEWCTSEYTSPSALLACEIRCSQDRGRE